MLTPNVSSTRTVPGALLGVLLAVCACNSQPSTKPSAQANPNPAERAQLTSEISAVAKVEAIDAATRIITLRREDGSLFRVKAGQDVRNFAQIAAGDALRVKYRETLEASVRPAGETAVPVEGAAGVGRAKAGATPAAAMGVAISVRVRIESIDREREIVVFSLASGELVARRLMTPEGRGFVKGRKIGDTVQLDYTETLAMSIDKL